MPRPWVPEMSAGAARILVAGGSLGGLLAANVLLRAGHDVHVLEKATGSLDGRGAGIVTHRRLVDALHAAGVAVDDSLGVTVQSRVALDPEGHAVARLDYPQVLTSWSRLYALLLAALPAPRYLTGREVERIDQDAHGVRVRCRNGEIHEAELLVASDGIRSAVRQQLAPAVQASYAGYVAWRGVCDETALSERTRSTLFGHFGFGLPAGEQIIGYPVAGPGNATGPGERRYNFVWYRPAQTDHALQALLTDAQGVHHAGGIAPSAIDRRQIAAMRDAAHRLLAPQWAEVIGRTAQPFLQPIHDLACDRLAFGRVALMGDAAFVARPHVGMGVTKAGEDAMALAASIRRHGPTEHALRDYEDQRLAIGRSVVERGRLLGAYMQAQGKHAEGPSAVESRRDALEVLRETAIDMAPRAPATAPAS